MIFEIYRNNVPVLLVRLALRNARSAEKEQGDGLVRQRNDGVHLLLKRYDDETEEQRKIYEAAV